LKNEPRSPNFRGMRLLALLLPLLGFVLSMGCERQKGSAAPVPAAQPDRDRNGLPTKAQPKLPTTRLWVGPEEILAELAISGAQQQCGMMFRTNMAENEGMLFVAPAPHQASFWMMNTPLPLSIAYLDSDGIILEIHDLQPHNTNSVTAASNRVQFALEMNQGWFQRHNISTGTLVRAESGPLRDIGRR
jgi:uncharacterized protein